MKTVKYIIIFIFILYAVFFAIANKHFIVLYLFPSPYQIKISAFLLVFCAFIFGFIFARLFNLIEMSKHHIQIKELKAQLDYLEKQYNKYNQSISK